MRHERNLGKERRKDVTSDQVKIKITVGGVSMGLVRRTFPSSTRSLYDSSLVNKTGLTERWISASQGS